MSPRCSADSSVSCASSSSPRCSHEQRPMRFMSHFEFPTLLRDLFAEGAMSSAFVPTFTEYLKNRGKKEAWELASNILNLLLIGLSLITLLGILFSEPLVSKFAGEFRTTPGKFELTVLLTQIMFPFLPMVALAAVLHGDS